MSDDPDDDFYNRADAHIHLSNDQAKEIGAGKVSASMMYGTARFNAWLSARGFDSAEEMQAAKSKSIEYYMNEYKAMLEENFDDYIQNFVSYMKPSH